MIALDIETTGLDPYNHCMISIGAIGINNNKEFYQGCRVYKNSKISDKALEINGFREYQLNDPTKPDPHMAYKNFLMWAQDNFDSYLLIGQNLPSFDVQFLKHYHYDKLDNNYNWVFGHRYIDLHSYVFAKTGKSQSHDDTLEMLGLPKEEKPHNALNGAKVVRKIFKEL